MFNCTEVVPWSRNRLSARRERGHRPPRKPRLCMSAPRDAQPLSASVHAQTPVRRLAGVSFGPCAGRPSTAPPRIRRRRQWQMAPWPSSPSMSSSRQPESPRRARTSSSRLAVVRKAPISEFAQRHGTLQERRLYRSRHSQRFGAFGGPQN